MAQRRSRTSNEVLYVDGFAGPGIYSGGEKGSPIIALETAMTHSVQFPIPVHFLFIELDPQRHSILTEQVRLQRAKFVGSAKVKIDDPILGDCNSQLSGILDGFTEKGAKFGPALVFLDQFGYSAVPISLVAKIMAYESCEVFSYLEHQYLTRFISDETKHAGIDQAFGGTEWRPAIQMQLQQRDEFLLEQYKAALKNRGGAKYVSTFSMYDNRNQLLYRLFFCTNNLRGLEEMKKAMWTVDKSGTFRFSDREIEGQQLLFLNGGFTDEWLAIELLRKFLNQSVTAMQIKEWVLTETPCVLFKTALDNMEKAGTLEVLNRVQLGCKRQFPDEFLEKLILKFSQPEKKFGGLFDP